MYATLGRADWEWNIGICNCEVGGLASCRDALEFWFYRWAVELVDAEDLLRI